MAWQLIPAAVVRKWEAPHFTSLYPDERIRLWSVVGSNEEKSLRRADVPERCKLTHQTSFKLCSRWLLFMKSICESPIYYTGPYNCSVLLNCPLASTDYGSVTHAQRSTHESALHGGGFLGEARDKAEVVGREDAPGWLDSLRPQHLDTTDCPTPGARHLGHDSVVAHLEDQ